ncbi:hypothetical protein [Brevundimonas sp. GCM10030266]|uniref:hypothetical protein n=1 Tax=Brevundimonas sp. GCM10030266 TaxID=3273386 RepID=UPI00362331C4
MSGGWRLLIALVGAVVLLGALAAGVVLSGRSLVIIDNRSEANLTLMVEATTPGDFSWSGGLKPGQRIYRLPQFTGDSSIRASCTDAGGVYRTTGGYVTGGWPHRVDVIAAGCASMRIETDMIP